MSRDVIFAPEVKQTDAKTGVATKSGGKSLRVAIVAPGMDILGGQGVQARSLTQALERDGVKVLFIAVNPRFPKGFRWLRRIPLLRTLVNQCLYIAGLTRVRRVDVVHVFSAAYWSFLLAPVPAILVARLFSRRIVLNYHSGEAEDHLANWGIRVHPWLRQVDDIVVPSAYLQTVFARHGYRAQVVRNIIDISGFHYRERHSLRPLLLSNRNLEAHYRVDITLQAFAIVKQSWPGARLIIAGYGSEQARLMQWVESRGLQNVVFLGRVEPEDMPKLYDEADIFVNSSVIDNQPVSILEAFASGLPVVSTPTGDIAAMAGHGRRGILIPRNNPVAMATAITALLDAPGLAASMANRAWQEVENYTWAQVGRQWIEIYRSDSLARISHQDL